MNTDLWKTDGTNTSLVKSVPFFSGVLTSTRNAVFFESNDALWISDGTDQGTVMLKDLRPKNVPFVFAHDFIAINDVLFFVVDVFGKSLVQLWTSDGTEAGTVMVQQFDESVGQIAPKQLAAGQDTLFYVAGESEQRLQLRKTDGTIAGTRVVADIPANSFPELIGSVGGTLYLTVRDDVNGRQLWKSDGISILSEVSPEMRLEPVDASTFVTLGNYLFLTMDDGIHGAELWKTDGTVDGTVIVADIVPGRSGSHPVQLTVVDGLIHFECSKSNGVTEIWKTAGTAATTKLVVTLDAPNSSSPFVESLTSSGGNLFFIADNGLGEELWVNEGATASTHIVRDIWPGTQGTGFGLSAKEVNGRLLVAAGLFGLLYSFDASGDVDLISVSVGDFGHLIEMNGLVYFGGDGLWQSDGTATGTRVIKTSIGPNKLTAVNGDLFFVADDGVHGSELWRSDGSPEGTTMIADITPGRSFLDVAPDMLVSGKDQLFFVADDGVHGRELWGSNGTSEGTRMIRDVFPGKNWFGPDSLVVVGSNVFFTGYDAFFGTALWKSDGTEDGTVLVRAGLRPTSFATIGDIVFFISGGGLWRSDGTSEGTRLVKSIRVPCCIPDPWPVVSSGEAVFFFNEDRMHGCELWTSDGTEAGTKLVKGTQVGDENACGSNPSIVGPPYPRQLWAAGNQLFFIFDDGEHGFELWSTDGSEKGTKMVEDVWMGPNSSLPRFIDNNEDTVWFAADDGFHGAELWKLKISTGAIIGDANRDGTFNSSDLVLIFQAGKYESNERATWIQGDWNDDGLFNSGDLVVAFQAGGYEQLLTFATQSLFVDQSNSFRRPRVELPEASDLVDTVVAERGAFQP